MLRIEDLIPAKGEPETTAYYEKLGRWLPAMPLPFYSIPSRFKDAWAVFRYKATAVQWPEQRDDL